MSSSSPGRPEQHPRDGIATTDVWLRHSHDGTSTWARAAPLRAVQPVHGADLLLRAGCTARPLPRRLHGPARADRGRRRHQLPQHDDHRRRGRPFDPREPSRSMTPAGAAQAAIGAMTSAVLPIRVPSGRMASVREAQASPLCSLAFALLRGRAALPRLRSRFRGGRRLGSRRSRPTSSDMSMRSGITTGSTPAVRSARAAHGAPDLLGRREHVVRPAGAPARRNLRAARPSDRGRP